SPPPWLRSSRLAARRTPCKTVCHSGGGDCINGPMDRRCCRVIIATQTAKPNPCPKLNIETHSRPVQLAEDADAPHILRAPVGKVAEAPAASAPEPHRGRACTASCNSPRCFSSSSSAKARPPLWMPSLAAPRSCNSVPALANSSLARPRRLLRILALEAATQCMQLAAHMLPQLIRASLERIITAVGALAVFPCQSVEHDQGMPQPLKRLQRPMQIGGGAAPGAGFSDLR